jgi:hypothetical protein
VTDRLLERRTDTPPQTTNDFLRIPQDPRKAARKLHKDHATVADWREWASWQPAALGWDAIPGVVEIDYWSLRIRAGRIDTSAPYLLGKAMVDGLVDARYLTDDQYKIVQVEHLRGPLVVGYYGIRLVIREVEGVVLPVDVKRPAARRPRLPRATRAVHTPVAGITLTGSPLIDGDPTN